jgi:hypothetical protein
VEIRALAASWNSSMVGTAIRLRSGRSGVRIPAGVMTFQSSPIPSTPALKPNESQVQLVRGSFSGAKAADA